jgi:hypothetical protein
MGEGNDDDDDDDIMPSTHLFMWLRESCCQIKKILKQNWISMQGLDVLFLVFCQTGGVRSGRESRARGIEGREMACHLGRLPLKLTKTKKVQ